MLKIDEFNQSLRVIINSIDEIKTLEKYNKLLVNNPTAYKSSGNNHINLVDQTGSCVEVSIHPPSSYICINRERILPDWKHKFCFWVVIVLQNSRYQLLKTTTEIESEKQRLREKFMRFGCDLAFNLRDRSYLTELIDPRTGYPLFSRPGRIPHDDTAAVKALLGYQVVKNKCRVIIHPKWRTAVYPSVLISQAPPVIMEWFIKTIAPMHGWEEI